MDDSDPYDLSPAQQNIVNRVLAGENIFFTGPAGSGKSAVIRGLNRAVRARFERSCESGADEAWLNENRCDDDGHRLNGITTDITRPRPWRIQLTASTGKAAV